MQSSRAHVIAVSAFLLATSATATPSFANRSLGLGVSAFRLVGESGNIDWGIPATLEGGLYIDNGFEAYVRVPLMLLSQPLLQPPFIWATGGQLGFRYLFLQESIRPYVNFHVAALAFLRNPVQVSVGPGAGGGIDFFVSDGVSIGPRVYADLFITLDNRGFVLSAALGGGGYVTAYF